MDIETDLRRWAAWAREHNELGVKPLVMFDDGTRGKLAFFPMSDDEGLAFDPAVATLKQIDKELYNVVRLHYLYGMSMRAVAMAAGMKTTAVHSAIVSAKTFIYGFLCGSVHESAKQALNQR
ncbi:antiterminator Q family protein [Enterobacter bugandensis]|uniref:antiterminator Q family protein n=1 Tax=Enterobacter bugandensis TaxID=881260 RepID=UPI00200491CA|nr:antiterminator Q family protein [Enterobacter bugandensis]MCK7435912.1 hypothetical protein [Enterobacter bugandensis]